ncbi:VOC family protein [Sphingomonas sp. DT-207]|uniref:VOC family protein n=1 Tax=Sphingomonas sp. DT-207 TaxID=3396167 RepID=UPI003F1CDE55
MSSEQLPHSLSAHLALKDARAAIDFYVAAFGATEDFRLEDPVDGRIGHAELTFGTSRLFLCDEYPEFGAVSPDTLGGSPVQMHLNVDDADAFVAAATAQGAIVLRPVKDQFYGHRSGLLADPFGYHWFIDAKVEDLTVAETQRRWSESTAI